MQRQYESIIIISPLLTEEQVKEVSDHYKGYLEKSGAEIINQENWGLKKLAYPIDKKSTGFYFLYEFKSNPEFTQKLEVEYRRDERILRFLTISLDKDAIAYSERRRKGEVGKRPGSKKEKKENIES